MNSKKLEKLEKHKKEIRRKFYLNILLSLIIGAGLAIILWPVAGIIDFLVGGSTEAATFILTLGVGIIVYMSPIIHFKEKNVYRSNKKPEYYLDEGLDKIPGIEILKSYGWEVVECSEDKIVLETYTSLFHKVIRKKTTLEMEILEKDENQQKIVFKSDGKEIEMLKGTINPKEDGSIIEETSISLRRYSPAYLELLLLIRPKIQETLQDVAEEKLDLLDENIEYGFSKFKLDSE